MTDDEKQARWVDVVYSRELTAMATIEQVLAPLDPRERRRLIRWLYDRFVDHPPPANPGVRQ